MKINVYELPIVKTYAGDINMSQESLYKSMATTEYINKQLVVDYLKSGVEFAALAELNHDVFSGQLIPYEALILTDGTYRWFSELVYYVENYNLELDEEFVQHVLKEKTVKITQQDL